MDDELTRGLACFWGCRYQLATQDRASEQFKYLSKLLAVLVNLDSLLAMWLSCSTLRSEDRDTKIYDILISREFQRR
jgi:hypothetical protein